MGQREVLLFIANLLDKYKIPYLLTGSFAVSYYGIPRATHDIDFVLEIEKKDYPKLKSAFQKLDASFLVDQDHIQEAVEKSSQFDILHLDSGIKIDFWSSGKSSFEYNKFKRKKEVILFQNRIHLISSEDLILTKLLWSKEIRSERHLTDCIGIWKVQEGKLDRDYLSSWAKKLDVESLLKEIISSGTSFH